MTPEPERRIPYDRLLDHMADAMIDPALRCEGAPSNPGNAVRKEVLNRALEAATRAGWRMMPIPKAGG